MPEPSDLEPVHPDVRYEPGDVKVRPILLFGLALIILGVIAQLTVMGLDMVLRKPEAHKPFPGALERPRFPENLSEIPPPRLEESDFTDLQELRRREETLLHDYGWVDPKQQKVRIPIEEAMRLLADPNTAAAHGIKVRPPAKGDRP